MATAGIHGDRVYTDQPVLPQSEAFKVRARLTLLELFALAAVIGACVSLIGYEYGVRRPARDAAAAAQAQARAPRAALPTPASTSTSSPPAVPAATTAQATGGASGTSAPMITPDAAATAAAVAAAAVQTPALARPEAPRRAGDDPFQAPGTIYRCRRYDGSLFWSSLHCAKQRGTLIDRIARVPADLPFDEQVRVASDEAKRVETSLRAEHAELQRMNTCAALVGEQAQILRRAGDVTVPSGVHVSDRARMTEIEATLPRLRCNG